MRKQQEGDTRRKNSWLWVIFVGVVIALLYFPGLVVEIISGVVVSVNNKEETAVTESACRGTASDYQSLFDGKTYTYACGSDGKWQYTDRFNDPSCNLIKGNIAFESKEKIYHTKGQAYYDDTSIDLEYGERWFCSEEEAVSAGWRKSYE
jgi:hypothetical protein